MLGYVYLGTNSLDKAVAFYSATPVPLGMERCLVLVVRGPHPTGALGVKSKVGIRAFKQFSTEPLCSNERRTRIARHFATAIANTLYHAYQRRTSVARIFLQLMNNTEGGARIRLFRCEY
jgi:hypothetical protein